MRKVSGGEKTMKARPLQEFTIEQIRRAGGTADVCTSVEAVQALLICARRDKERGHWVAIELKNDGKYANETALKRQVLAMIRKKFSASWVYKTSDRWQSGIPDLLICLG